MDFPTEAKYFKDTNTPKQERKNFRNYIFDKLEIKGKETEKFSFYRSDFRATRTEQCDFKYVYFDMADFIDFSVFDSNFHDCDFGNSEIKNGYYQNCTFHNNQYLSSIQKSIYNNCEFLEENFCASAHEVTFESCSFKNCNFEGSTFEDISFKNCTFYNCELSTMHAEDFTFENCRLEDVVWGIDYWFTYLIFDTKISNIKLKYRGRYIDFFQDRDIMESMLNDLIKNHNYFEYLNILILQQSLYDSHRSIRISNHLSLYKRFFSELIHSENYIHRKKQLLKLFEMIQFYFFRENFNLYDSLSVIEYINSFTFDTIPFEEAVLYKAEIYKINELFSELPFTYEQILSIPYEHELYASIRLNYETKEEALTFIENTFDMLAKMMGIEPGEYYKITNIKNGSWIIELISSSIFILTLYKLFKDGITFALKTKIRIKLSSFALEGIEKNSHTEKDIEYIEKSLKLLEHTGLFESHSLTSDFLSKEQLSKILELGIKFTDNSKDNV